MPPTMRRTSRSSIVPTVVVVALIAGGASASYYAQPWTRGISPTAVAAVLAARLAAEDSTLTPARAVYAARGGQPVWMNPEARDAALALLASADRDGLPVDPEAVALAVPDPAPTDTSLADVDLRLTAALVRLGDALSRPRVDGHALYGSGWYPSPQAPPDVPAMLARALTAPDVPAALTAWADSLRPPHEGYRRLRAALGRELDLAARPDLALDRDLAPGDSGAAIVALRERLAIEGASVPGSATFDAPLAQALRHVQRRLGLPSTGRLDAATRGHLNRRRPDLVPLMALNLERWRWLPRDLGALHVWVNVPTFELAVRERTEAGWHEVLRSPSVVGTRGWETPIFSDTMETVVFNPTWTIPASIQREQYGRVIGPMVRPPGPGNALGRVKFLFPNDHAVYIHDTPSKWAFSQAQRARSHGCIRAADPQALATALLTRTNGWDADEVAAIFRGPWRLRSVRLERPVPVHLVYFTAWADGDRVEVAPDIYERDRALAGAIGVELMEIQPDPEEAPDLIADEA